MVVLAVAVVHNAGAADGALQRRLCGHCRTRRREMVRGSRERPFLRSRRRLRGKRASVDPDHEGCPCDWAPRSDDRSPQCGSSARGPSSETVWAEVVRRRKGIGRETFGWDFDLVRTEDGCRVWTVVAADRPTRAGHLAIDVIDDPDLCLGCRRSGERPTHPTRRRLAVGSSGGEARTVRASALVAWVVVVTLGGVAFAGYLAPRLERRRES